MSYAQFAAETREKAKRAGVVGAILGAIVSLVGIRLVWLQYEQHMQFERLANSTVVQQQLRLVQPSPDSIPDPSAQQEESGELSAPVEKESGSQSTASSEGVLSLGDDDPQPTEVNAGGIKVIHWAADYAVESLELDNGRWIYPTPASPPWAYLLVAMCPVVGFLIPWTLIRVFSREQILFSHQHAEDQDLNVRRLRR